MGMLQELYIFCNHGTTITVLVFFMNDLTANETQVMCPGCELGNIWLRHLHPNYIAQICNML